MRTVPLNTYKVTFHYTVEVEAVHEDEARALAESDIEEIIDRRVLRHMSDTVELIDGIEPGQED